MIAEFPVNVGAVQAYAHDHAFAVTPSKKYYQKDIQEFLDDVAKSAQSSPETEESLTVKDKNGNLLVAENGEPYRLWTTRESLQGGRLFWPGVEKMSLMMAPPVVPTHIVYSKGFDTITCVKFDDGDLTQTPRVEEVAPGDDTVTAASVETLAEAWRKMGLAEVHLHVAPDDVHHKDLVNCDFTLGLLSELLGGKDASDEDASSDDA